MNADLSLDLEARKELHQSLTKFLAGEMSIGRFDELYLSKWSTSSDKAVFEIAEHCWALCAVSDNPNHRLKSDKDVTPEQENIAGHSLLFLKTNLEYEWPRLNNLSLVWLMSFFVRKLSMAVGGVLLITSIILAGTGRDWKTCSLLTNCWYECCLFGNWVIRHFCT
ncbi:MAG TPA: hypothetical protein VGZ25_09870 [Gemmataceae bacterium]|nr:hypothetical protein [Gemmataceae bacterium]